MKKRVTGRILAWLLVFLMVCQTVTGEGLTITARAEENGWTEDISGGDVSGGEDISGGNTPGEVNPGDGEDNPGGGDAPGEDNPGGGDAPGKGTVSGGDDTTGGSDVSVLGDVSCGEDVSGGDGKDSRSETYTAVVFGTEEELSGWENDKDESTAVLFQETELQDVLEQVKQYGKDSYVAVVAGEEAKDAETAAIPANVKKLVLDSAGGEVQLDKMEVENNETAVKINCALAASDKTFTMQWANQTGGEVYFAAGQEKLTKIISGDADGNSAGTLLVPDGATVTLPYITGFSCIRFQGGTLQLTGENETYHFENIRIEKRSKLELPAYREKYVPKFDAVESGNGTLKVAFADTSDMKFGSRILKYGGTTAKDNQNFIKYLSAELPYGVLDYEGVLRRIAIYDEDTLQYVFQDEDEPALIRSDNIFLWVPTSFEHYVSNGDIVASDSSTVCRNSGASVEVAATGTSYYKVTVGIHKTFSPTELYLWYNAKGESFLIGKLKVDKAIEGVQVVEVYGWEPVTYANGMPGETDLSPDGIFPRTVKARLSNGREVELDTWYSYGETQEFDAFPKETTTYKLKGTIGSAYAFAEGVSKEIFYQVTVEGQPHATRQTEGLSEGAHTRSEYEENPRLVFESAVGEATSWCFTSDGSDPKTSETRKNTPTKEFIYKLNYAMEKNDHLVLRFYIMGDEKHPESPEYRYEFSVCYEGYNITVEEIPAQNYTGAQIKPVVKAYDGDKLLTVNKDYTLTYKNNINAASADSENPPMVILKGKGIYSDTIEIPFTIKPGKFTEITGKSVLPLTEVDGRLTADLRDVGLVVKDGKKVLKEGRDYELIYTLLMEGDVGYRPPSTRVTCEDNTWGNISIKGLGNYGTRENFYFVLSTQTDLSKAKITFAQKKMPYMGVGENDNLNPVTVTLNGKVIDPKYYDVTYENNQKPGTASVTVTAKKEVDGSPNSYVGELSATYPIVRAKLSEAVFDNKGKIADKEYEPGKPVTLKNGVDYTLSGRHADGSTDTSLLWEGVDYKVTYEKNEKAGTATVIFTALDGGVYNGSVKKTFKIVKPALFVKNTSTKKTELNENLEILVASKNNDFHTTLSGSSMGDMGSFCYDEEGVKPEIYVRYKGVLLKEGVDYKCGITGNKTVSTYDKNGKPVKYAAITITGMGNFTGTLKGNVTDAPGLSFTVTPRWLSRGGDTYGGRPVFCSVPSVVYKKGAKTTYKPVPFVGFFDGTLLKAGRDYTVTYMDNTNENIPVDEATGLPQKSVFRDVKIEFKGNYRGEAVCSYEITPYDFSKVFVTVDPQIFSLSGDSVPVNAIHVKASKDSTEELVYGEDYIIPQNDGTGFIGTGVLYLVGTGKYSGSRTVKYKVEKIALNADNQNITVSVEGNTDAGSDSSDMYMDKKGAVPKISVVYGGHWKLEEGVDYTVSYANNKTVSTDKKTATYKITGKRYFSGTISGSYKVVPYDLHNLTMDSAFQWTWQPVVYSPTAKSYPVKMTVKQNGILLKEGKDYYIEYYKYEGGDGKYTKDAPYFTEEEIVNGNSFFMYKLVGMGDYTGTSTDIGTAILPVALNKMNVTFDSPLDYGTTSTWDILSEAKITYKIGKNTYTMDNRVKNNLNLGIQNVSVNGLNGKAVLVRGSMTKSFTFKYKPKSVK